MNRKHVLYATSALLLVGGGTLSVIKLTSDSADKTDNAITVESTHDDITTETVAEASTEAQSASDKDDRKKDDNNTTTASTAEISSNISSEGNGNSSVSSGNSGSSGTTAPPGNGSSSGNGNSSGNGSSSGGNGSSGNGSSGNGGSTGGGSSNEGGNSGGGGSTGGNSGPVAPVHTHDWQPVYKTVHHDEVSHTEKVKISDDWDEPVYAYGYRCNRCNSEFPPESVVRGRGGLLSELWSRIS